MSARMTVAAMILIVGACGNGVTDSNPKRLIRLRGNVTSAATQAPIQGAQISLKQGDGFFPDRVLVSTTTAAAGNYSLEYSATVPVISGGCGIVFLIVRTAGFQNTPAESVLCIDDLVVVPLPVGDAPGQRVDGDLFQTFDFAL